MLRKVLHVRCAGSFSVLRPDLFSGQGSLPEACGPYLHYAAALA